MSVCEHVVPLNIISHASAAGRYTDQDWDYSFMSHSPGYFQRQLTRLLTVIAACMDA